MAGRLLVLVALVPYALWLVTSYDYHFLDGVNLAFHEFGHLFFGFGPKALAVAGGSLMQLLVPGGIAAYFAFHGRLFDACIALFWLGESLLYLGMYVGDARALALPLVGGHIHDWNWLFHRFGGLDHAEAFGSALHALGSLVLLAAWVAAARQAWAERPDGRVPAI